MKYSKLHEICLIEKGRIFYKVCPQRAIQKYHLYKWLKNMVCTTATRRKRSNPKLIMHYK